eukprot:TRINITY_DN738_c0_g1_i3.p1 TRINITY_DN738_c0_g1~~TRINITY_DN738_c0_g1_i3.p1  ORF type:complete len:450 (-),score=116.71 TRINITY_DN738_c0_g1_i3:634-1983(-)
MEFDNNNAPETFDLETFLIPSNYLMTDSPLSSEDILDSPTSDSEPNQAYDYVEEQIYDSSPSPDHHSAISENTVPVPYEDKKAPNQPELVPYENAYFDVKGDPHVFHDEEQPIIKEEKKTRSKRRREVHVQEFDYVVDEVEQTDVPDDHKHNNEELFEEESKRSSPSKQQRPKKRRKLSSTKEKVSKSESVLLSREDLLTYNSDQFENYVRELMETRDLTQKEQNELKRQRRLIKNRESAQASRQRKKGHMEELEKKVQELSDENARLKEHIATLQAENTTLKSEISFFQTVVNKAGVGNLVPRSSSTSNTTYGKAKSTNSQHHYHQHVPAASGLVLLLVLFSFGLFFNFETGFSKSLSDGNSIKIGSTSSRRILNQHENYRQTSSSFDLLGVLNREELPKGLGKRLLESAQRLNGNNNNNNNNNYNFNQLSHQSTYEGMVTIKHIILG